MRISIQKTNKTKKEIYDLIKVKSPLFPMEIAKEINRDEEFTKRLLEQMEIEGFLESIHKNNKGIEYTRRSLWKLGKNEFLFEEQPKENKVIIKKLPTRQHFRDLRIIGEKIRARIIHPHSSKHKDYRCYEPDLIKEDTEFEIEYFGGSNFIKLKSKWQYSRFDLKKPSKRVLIVTIPDELKDIFDEVYFYQSKESMEVFYNKYGNI